MINNNINGREDFDRLNALQKETGKKIAALKTDFENCKKLYVVYADIAKTYYEISMGDYVSNMWIQIKFWVIWRCHFEYYKYTPSNKAINDISYQ